LPGARAGRISAPRTRHAQPPEAEEEALQPDLSSLVARHARELGPEAADLAWLRPTEAADAEAARRRRLDALTGRVAWGFSDTKLDVERLSPGCQACGEGVWSCLFINGSCGAGCFFCPTPQDEEGLPQTNTLAFPEPEGYLDYLDTLGFRDVSLSGGEPLATPERTLTWLRALRAHRPDAHLWLYSSGRLVDQAAVDALAEAGLDELRLNLIATRWDLEPLRLAARRIPRVTIEIPAVPEHAPRLQALLPDLAEAGLRHLNLHQLRLTPHNRRAVLSASPSSRWLCAPRVVSVESEWTALDLVAQAHAQGLPFGINYCSSIFKIRHQEGAARRRAIQHVAKPAEDLTPAGYLRRLSLTGPSDALGALARDLGAPRGPKRWSLTSARDRLPLARALWPQVAPALADPALSLWVGYDEAFLVEAPTYQNPFTKVALGEGRTVVAERRVAWAARPLAGAERAAFEALVLAGEGDTDAPPHATGAAWTGWLGHERVRRGLQVYAEAAAEPGWFRSDVAPAA